MNIIMIDKHTLSKNILANFLNSQTDIKVVDTLDSGHMGLKRCAELKGYIDLVIMDIKLPDLPGLLVAKTIIEDNPELKVALLTTAVSKKLVMEAISIGVSGYFSRLVEPELLVLLLREVMGGYFCTSPDISNLIACYFKNGEEPAITATKPPINYSFLSRRELDVLNLLQQGLYNKDIATKLCISENTVKNHLQSIYEKLGVNNRTQAIAAMLAMCSEEL